ncbi:hypothetical protein [Paraburkholderia sp. DHOC27]|uniref:hypothetical protein n=1 Tax=Paraburkholderia sp. DHOC27 TaxID=2303330 RepID=UPI0011C184CB|nr:hypothetical protein [Paraburkholderia sp. DHOC27]
MKDAARALCTFFIILSCSFLITACSDDSNASNNASANPDTNTADNYRNGNNSGNATSPPLAQQFNQSPAALPAQSLQTPPPAAQLGAATAASESLAPPVIHTVD